MLDEVAQRRVGEAVLVGPGRIAEHATEARVGAFDLTHGLRDSGADVLRRLADVVPVGTGRDLEAMLFGESGVVRVAIGILERLGVLLVINIGEAFEEEKWEDERLVLSGIDRASQKGRRAP